MKLEKWYGKFLQSQHNMLNVADRTTASYVGYYYDGKKPNDLSVPYILHSLKFQANFISNTAIVTTRHSRGYMTT